MFTVNPRYSRIALQLGAVCALAVGVLVVARPSASAVTPSVPHALGRKEITCPYVSSNKDDFLVHPGASGASHEHDYFGARGVTATTTVNTIRGHGTSCPQSADESGYWAPSLHVGGTTYRPTAAHVYYERNTKAPVTAFPAGFHMIVGNAMQMTADTNNANIYFGCARADDPRSTQVNFSTCSSGGKNTFAIWLNFPNCWDGKQSSSPSLNLVYSTGSSATCPSDHPVLLPSVHYTIWYELPTSQTFTGITLSSGPMGSAHADFVNGWSTDAMNQMVSCINTDNRDCS